MNLIKEIKHITMRIDFISQFHNHKKIDFLLTDLISQLNKNIFLHYINKSEINCIAIFKHVEVYNRS